MSLATEASIGTEREASTFVLRDHAIVTFVSILVFLPSALFATALRPIPALLVITGCLGALILIVRQELPAQAGFLRMPTQVPRLLLCVALALVIFLLGGETHLFFATSDWLVRDAVLADLVQHGFPVAYRLNDTDYLLRAPLGMYMIPASVGRLLGLYAAHVALLLQNGLFLGSIFYFMTRLGHGWRHLAILVLFAGLSLAGALFRISGAPRPGTPFWLEYGLDSWHPFYQYSGSIVQFFWVPNHALPGWWLATLFLLQKRSSVDVAVLGVTVAGLSFWSPLAILPVVPWILYCTATAWRPVLLSVRTWLGLASAACFLPILPYLLAASSSIAHAILLANPSFGFWYGFFIVLQLPALFFLAVFWRRVPRELRALVAINGLVLLALPFFHFGPNNDLVMRASIASLTIVAFAFGSVVLDLTGKHSIGAVVGWALILTTSASAWVEIGRTLSTPRFDVSGCSLIEATEALSTQGYPTNYMVPIDAVPTWLLDPRMAPIVPVVRHACWPDIEAPRYLGLRYKTVSKP